MITVDCLTKQEWLPIAADAHLTCFNEIIEPDFNNIDFALISKKGERLLTYCTVRQLDKETCYWQYGGALPECKDTVYSYKGTKASVDACFSYGYKRISFYVENDNLPMLKLALKLGFRVIGLRNFKKSILLELFLEKQEG